MASVVRGREPATLATAQGTSGRGLGGQRS